MNHNEGVPEEEDKEMPSIKTKEEEIKVDPPKNDDDIFDEPIDGLKEKVQPKKKMDIPYFLNKIEIPIIKTSKLIEKGNCQELENEYQSLFQK